MDSPQGSNRPIWAFNQAEFERQERICKSKCYSMKNKVVADDDIVPSMHAWTSARTTLRKANLEGHKQPGVLAHQRTLRTRTTQRQVSPIHRTSSAKAPPMLTTATTGSRPLKRCSPVSSLDTKMLNALTSSRGSTHKSPTTSSMLRPCDAKDAPTRTSQQPPESQKAPSNITGSPTNARHSKRSPASSRPTPNYSTTSTPLPKPQHQTITTFIRRKQCQLKM